MDAGAQAKVYENVLGYIKQQILNGELQKGDKLPPERELAEELKVGRNSVREALRVLDIMGVITSTQGAGNYLSCNYKKNLVESMTMMFLLEQIDYQQLSELREAIEIKAAALAADKISMEQVEELQNIVSELGSSSDEAYCAELDKRLHYIIGMAAHNVLIFEILEALSNVIDIFICNLRGKILLNPSSRERLQQIHEDIVAGLRSRDKTQIVAAFEEHFRLINENIAEAEREHMFQQLRYPEP